MLTPAERLVAAHLVQGLANKEIATLISRSESTIKNQVGSVLAKTGVPTRTRFIAQYYQQFICVLTLAPASAGGNIAPPVRTIVKPHSDDGRPTPSAGGSVLIKHLPPCGHNFGS